MIISRKALKGIKPYSPGKRIEEVKRELGLNEIHKLASNENPLGPSPKAIEAISNSLDEMNLYPDGNCTDLKDSLAFKYDLPKECFIIGNGSDELIKYIGESFLNPEDNIVIGDPTFSEYAFAGKIMGAEIRKVSLLNFKFNLSALKEKIDRNTKIVVICNPNNPTGSVVYEEEIREFISGINNEILVVFDEAYMEYAGDDFFSGRVLLKEGLKNIIVLNTFSKIYGLASLRIGYAIGEPSLIDSIAKVKEPFNVNSLAQIGAEAALEDVEHLRESKRINEEGKLFLYEEFNKRNIKYIETSGNFIWFELKKDSDEVFKELLEYGIIVRQGSVFGFKNHVRITIGEIDELELFIKSLDKVLK